MSDGSPDRVVARPRRTMILASIVIAALVGSTVVGWFALPAVIRGFFQIAQIITLLLILAGLVLGLTFLAASSVRADAAGLRVRNGPRVHRLAWSELAGIRMRTGDPWARALLRDPDPASSRPDHVMMMGLQAVDGERSRRRLSRMRALHAAATGGRYHDDA